VVLGGKEWGPGRPGWGQKGNLLLAKIASQIEERERGREGEGKAEGRARAVGRRRRAGTGAQT
jgi:hypothetical protein